MPDNNRSGTPASITAVGLALAAYPVGVERHYLPRAEAAARTLTTLRTFRDGGAGRTGWISKRYYGLDQGPIVLMIENYRSGFPWRLMRKCPHLVVGLRRAGFRDGWLSRDDPG